MSRRPVAAFALAVTFGVVVPALPANAAAGPPLETPESTLAAAVTCSADVDSPQRTPVLLVHGTFTTPEETWSWGYQRVLRAAGHPVCTIALPDRAEVDLQVSAEYVVHAVRTAHSRAGQEIAVVGHSQGGALIPWALRFWPDLTGMVDDAIALSGPQSGTDLGAVLCAAGRCPDVAWQMRTGSNWTTALTRDPLPAGPSFSSIGSHTDEVVYPAPRATTFPGATNVFAQEVCPHRPIGHLGMLSDAAVHALVLDAIGHPGPASPERVGRAVCALVDYPGLDPVGRARLLDTGTAIVDAFATLPYTAKEPPLRDYAG